MILLAILVSAVISAVTCAIVGVVMGVKMERYRATLPPEPESALCGCGHHESFHIPPERAIELFEQNHATRIRACKHRDRSDLLDCGCQRYVPKAAKQRPLDTWLEQAKKELDGF